MHNRSKAICGARSIGNDEMLCGVIFIVVHSYDQGFHVALGLAR